MKIIAAISQKGGVGKTSVLVNIAAIAASAKERVWIIDMDKQASADRWGEVREANAALPKVRVEMAHTAATLGKVIMKARADGANLVLIDTPQGADDEHFNAIALAHLVLIPSKPYFFDANSILRTIQRAEKEPREAYVLFTDVETGERGAKHVAGTRAAIDDAAPGAQFCEHIIHHSAEIPEAAANGMGVIEVAPTKQAAKEFKKLAAWALDEASKVAAIVAKDPAEAASLNAMRARFKGRGGK